MTIKFLTFCILEGPAHQNALILNCPQIPIQTSHYKPASHGTSQTSGQADKCTQASLPVYLF